MVAAGSKKRPDSGLESGITGGGKEAKQHDHQFHGQSTPAGIVIEPNSHRLSMPQIQASIEACVSGGLYGTQVRSFFSTLY